MKIEFKDIPYFSKLFLDFINKDGALSKFFPSNYIEDRNQLFNLRLNQTNAHRYLYKGIIKDSYFNELTKSQLKNYELVSEKTSLFVITGQQPGIYGGPLYSLYKSFSAISYCEKYKSQYPNFNFIPLFWVEDSDDDIDEVNKYTFIDSNYEVDNLKLDNIKKKKLSHFEINQSIENVLNKLIGNSSNLENSEINNFLNSLTTSRNLLPDNFIESINYLTRDYGLLFVKSSELFKNKIYNDLILEDLFNPGKISNIVEKTNSQLIENQYNVQASSSEINFFYSRDDRRHKIVYTDNLYIINGINYTEHEFKEIVKNSNEIFTPKVLLRPIIQDYMFPTAAYVGGAGEIAYFAQLHDLYEHFNLNMPIIEPRHSITVINNNINRILEKENLNITSIFKNYQEIEKEIAQELIDDDLENKFNYSENKLKEIFNELSPTILEIDKSLTTNIDMSTNKSLEQLSNLKKKVLSQLKKKNEVRFSRILKSNKYLYPNNNLQERELNIFNFINDNNKEDLISQIYEISKKDANYHYILTIK